VAGSSTSPVSAPAFRRRSGQGAYKYSSWHATPASRQTPASMASQVGQLPPPPPSRPLPVINLGRLSKDPATRALAIQDIARACREQGCFQVSVCCSLFSDTCFF